MSARAHIVPVFVPHLGCPHDCVFCSQRQIAGQTEPAGPEDVAAALAPLRALPPRRRGLAFYGGSFTAVEPALRRALLQAAQPWLREGVISSIRVSTRPDAVDADVLGELRAFGVTVVELGAQSMDDGVLRAAGRGHTAEDTCRAAALVKEAGLQLVLQMMTGLPGATDESDFDTARALTALEPDGVRVYPTVVLRGTALFGLWQRGAYRAQSVQEAAALCARLVPVFEQAGVAVLRVGLHASDMLGAAVAAGPYHPAFGELVRARIWCDRAAALLAALPTAGRAATVYVHPSRISQMTGQKKENLTALRRQFGLFSVRVCAAACAPDALRVTCSAPAGMQAAEQQGEL